jgi:hypothetical protein
VYTERVVLAPTPKTSSECFLSIRRYPFSIGLYIIYLKRINIVNGAITGRARP